MHRHPLLVRLQEYGEDVPPPNRKSGERPLPYRASLFACLLCRVYSLPARLLRACCSALQTGMGWAVWPQILTNQRLS